AFRALNGQRRNLFEAFGAVILAHENRMDDLEFQFSRMRPVSSVWGTKRAGRNLSGAFAAPKGLPGIYLASCSGCFDEMERAGTMFAASHTDMSIQLPSNDGQLIVLGNNMVHGLTLDGSALGITQISAAQL